MRRLASRTLACSVLVMLSVSFLTTTSWAQANVKGQWSTLPYTMPINPIHVALLNNGKVVVVAGSGNVAGNTNYQAALWDPQAATITTQPVAWDMFCNGMVVLPDGRPFINGGTLQYDPFHGQPKSSIFDPSTNTFTDVQNMAHGRWYPTVTTLGDGRVMTFSGANETGATDKAVEIYTVGSGWSVEYAASWTPPLYPRLHLLPNGKVFYSGSTTTSRLFDPTAHTWTNVATTNYSGTRTYGTSVLLALTPANNYDPRVIIMGGGNPSTATTEIIDLAAPAPAWQSGPSMSQPRIEMNAVMLPNGKILALGGSYNDEDTKYGKSQCRSLRSRDQLVFVRWRECLSSPLSFGRTASTRCDCLVHWGESSTRLVRAAHGNLQPGVFVQLEWNGSDATDDNECAEHNRLGRTIYCVDAGCSQYFIGGAGASRGADARIRYGSAAGGDVIQQR